MSLETRVEKLEQQTGVRGACPVCDAQAPEVAAPDYDESVWRVGTSRPVDFDCVHCGRPRRIVVDVLERRNDAA